MSADDNCVHPLFEHVFVPRAPSLAFIGLPWKVVPFPMFELQAKLVARVLSGAATLPPRNAMERAALAALPVGTTPRRHAHAMTIDEQFAYNDRLAALAGAPPLPPWRKQMYAENSRNKRARPDTYRDVWDDEHARQQVDKAAATV